MEELLEKIAQVIQKWKIKADGYADDMSKSGDREESAYYSGLSEGIAECLQDLEEMKKGVK